MKFRGLVFAALVLSVLSAALYWSNRHPSTKTTEPAAAPSPKILALNQDDIVKIEIKKRDGDVLLAKNDSGTWHIVAPQESRADSGTVSSLVSSLAPLTADRIIDEKATDLQPFGLKEPAVELVVTTKNNQSQRLLIGDETPSHNGAYATVAGQPQVYTVPSYVKSSLDKKLDDLRNKKLFDFGFTDPSKIELRNGTKTYSLKRSGPDWWWPDGKKMEAGGVSSLIDHLRDLHASKFVDSGFGKPVIEITVTSPDNGHPEKVLLAKDGEDYVARRENESQLYQVDSKSVADLQHAAEQIKSETPKPTPETHRH